MTTVDAYTHIPIHIRLTDRKRIDPGYDPETYRKHEYLLGLAKGRRYMRSAVPNMVLRWIEKDSSTRLGPAAVALGMEAEDLRSVMRRFRGKDDD